MDSEKQLSGLKWRGGGSLGYQVVGIIEGTDCMEHWVGEKNNEYCFSENKEINLLKKNIVKIFILETRWRRSRRRLPFNLDPKVS